MFNWVQEGSGRVLWRCAGRSGGVARGVSGGQKIKVFKRGASYAAREKGAKRGSKRDKRDAVTPAAGSGGQGDQAGDRATLRDRVGRRAGSLSRVHPTRLRGAWPSPRASAS